MQYTEKGELCHDHRSSIRNAVRCTEYAAWMSEKLICNFKKCSNPMTRGCMTSRDWSRLAAEDYVNLRLQKRSFKEYAATWGSSTTRYAFKSIWDLQESKQIGIMKREKFHRRFAEAYMWKDCLNTWLILRASKKFTPLKGAFDSDCHTIGSGFWKVNMFSRFLMPAAESRAHFSKTKRHTMPATPYSKPRQHHHSVIHVKRGIGVYSFIQTAPIQVKRLPAFDCCK